MNQGKMFLPDSWLGVFGGGQLGRMFTHAAQRMGYHVAILDHVFNCPAAQAADRMFVVQADNALQSVTQFAQACPILTLEFENVCSAWLRHAEQFSQVRPNAEFLEICQDRLLEKSSLSQAGFPTTPFLPVRGVAEILQAGETLGWPIVVKTARSGYDGKGQVVVHQPAEAIDAWKRLQTDRAIAEQMIDFQAEVSIICARNASGEIVTYPLLENAHAHHILDVTRCPVRIELARHESRAQEIAQGIANRFQVEGLFCVECFVAANGELLINEMAPRPHNSGHLTIEAFNCSQFEQQVRAVCNLPLRQPRQLAPAAMANLLGDLWITGAPAWGRPMAADGAFLHLYGKSSARPGRKMGHLTCLADNADCAELMARQLRDSVIQRK